MEIGILELEFQEGNSDEIVHYINWDVSQNKDMVLYWVKESQQRHSVLMESQLKGDL